MTSSNAQIPKSPRILLVRLSAIGDVVQSMPMICALRDRFPSATLAWAVEEVPGQMLQGHDAIDELITLPRGWLKSPKTVLRLRRRLRDMRFDIAIDGQGLSKSAIAAWLSGAPRRIGFGDYWGREFSRLFNNELVKTIGPHIVQRNMQLLAPLDIDQSRVRFGVPVDQNAVEEVDQLVREHGLSDGFALFCCGAGWPSKLWPTERYARVAACLGKKWSLPSIVAWGIEKERPRAEEVVTGSQGHAWLAPQTSLSLMAELARRATLLVGSDTGPLHLGAAVGAPCIGLYGPWPAERHGPYGEKNIALQEVFFEGSTRERRNAPPYFMQAISTQLVCEACDRVIDREGRKAA